MSAGVTEGKKASLGRDQFVRAVLLALGGWAGCLVLKLLLYFRPAPNGGPFLVEWPRYFPLALYYDLLGVWLLSAPFLLLWLALYRRPLRSHAWRLVPVVQVALLAANLCLTQIDHELLRFLGVRLNLSFLQTYAQPQMLSDGLFLDTLASDSGGSYVPVLLLVAVPALYLLWAMRSLRRGGRWSPALWIAVLLVVLPIAIPGNTWRKAGSQFRLRKVEPLVLALAVDLQAGFEDRVAPPDLDRLATEYQHAWLARSADKGWHFPDPARPYLRVPDGPAAAAGAPWNIIYLQLETLRGVDMGFLGQRAGPSPTPYLDSLVARPDTATWTRAASFGVPSINGLFATHCSVMPPSQRYITGFTHVDFQCLPEVLRRRGYRAEMYNGGDTDWDNSTPWLTRWYDRLERFPQAEGRDRTIFREAAARIRRLGRSNRPFFASVVSVSNHWPFRTREPAFDIAGQAAPEQRIRNTTHYTDDVVREFIEGLRGEPWFARTLIVIAGDHGFNLGEHGQPIVRQDLYRESVWVPLIVAGPHPRLRPGLHDTPATLLDLAPTLADLLGIRTATPWQGHSLLAVNATGVTGVAFRDSLFAADAAWSAVRDPRDARVRLYANDGDWLQRHDLAARHPALVQGLTARVDRARRLHDYLLRHNLLWQAGRRP
jgi:hypothetical protein